MYQRLLNIFATCLLCSGAFTAGAQQKAENVLDVKTSITDSNIVYPESFEADTRKMLEGWYMKNYMATDDRYRRQGDTRNDDKTIR